MSKILIIDDEEKLRTLLARILSLEDMEVFQANNAKLGLKRLDTNDIDVVLCDVKLPDASGVELVKSIKTKHPFVEVILFTAFGNIPDGVQAMKHGAFDYITKGDDNNKIIPLINRALEKVALSRKVQQLQQRLGHQHSFDKIIGGSKAMAEAIALSRKVAQTDTTVLLTGETGTGKEVFAQAIHHESLRSNQNFVAINCSAFSKDLLESELFGHKAGAFTGAIRDKKGLFEEANKGTIFLDEIGDMPLELQAKILRVIEAGEMIKVGDSSITKVNVRIISATNRSLVEEVEKGNFREDLYYRLSVFHIPLPPLRERPGDIEALAKHYISFFASKVGRKVIGIDSPALHALQKHPWKGNIRELRNIIERAIILSDGDTLTLVDLPVDLRVALDQHPSKGKLLSAYELASAEKLHIQKVLNHAEGNKTKTAELLGIALTTLYRKLAEYQIS